MRARALDRRDVVLLRSGVNRVFDDKVLDALLLALERFEQRRQHAADRGIVVRLGLAASPPASLVVDVDIELDDDAAARREL